MRGIELWKEWWKRLIGESHLGSHLRKLRGASRKSGISAINAPQNGAYWTMEESEENVSRLGGKKMRTRIPERARSGISWRMADLTVLSPLLRPVPASQWGTASRR